MSLVHIDRQVLDSSIGLSTGAGTAGTMPKTGALMGKEGFYQVLRITSPVASKPWRFPSAYLSASFTVPLGVERSIYRLTWRAVPYQADPYGGGNGAQGAILFDYT